MSLEKTIITMKAIDTLSLFFILPSSFSIADIIMLVVIMFMFIPIKIYPLRKY
jgi:hypothetical protein